MKNRAEWECSNLEDYPKFEEVSLKPFAPALLSLRASCHTYKFLHQSLAYAQAVKIENKALRGLRSEVAVL